LNEGFADRVGASFRRAPYVWLAATILLTVVLNTPLFELTKDRDEASTLVAIIAAG